jgi:hypothetical protein
MKVLNNLATSKFSQIPVIGQSVYPANWTTIRQLFDDWEPKLDILVLLIQSNR